MTRPLNKASEEKIKGFEGLRLTAYDDARPDHVLTATDTVQGTLTIGWGHTGPDVSIGQTIDMAKAQEFFDSDTAGACKCVDDCVKVPLNDNQFGALVSFTYNVGCGPFTTSTLLKRLNAGDYAAVPDELKRWNKQRINGRVTVDNGLVVRRASECGLWASGSMARGANITPEAPPPVWRSVLATAHLKIKAAGASLAGLGLGGDALQNAGHKLSDLATMWHGLAVVGVAFVVVGVLMEMFHHADS